MISLKNITKNYDLGEVQVKALKNINLNFEEKGFICIHGPSGCGKTTLLNIVGGLDLYTSGTLIIDNVDTTDFKDGDWDSYRNQKVGFVFQNYHLLPQLNVFENVEIALELVNYSKDKRIELVNKALERVDLLDQAKKMPNQLSGGQIQRVAIARAIVNEPSVVLADEPTGALDSKNAKAIMEILKEISKTQLILLVSHNTELATIYADRVIEMLDGEIISDNKKVEDLKPTTQYTKQKTSMSFLTSFKISIRNLFRTKLRSILIIFAGSIGMIGIGLVLSIAKGLNLYIEDVQKSALVSYPIRISSSSKILDDSGEEKPPLLIYPEEEEVYILKGQSKMDYYNVIDKGFVDYLEEMDNNLYSLINYNRRIKMNLIYHNEDINNYEVVYNSYFVEMTEDLSFMSNQYDKLYGEYPTSYNELALVVSSYNSISASILDSLKVKYDDEKISFSDIVGTEYKLINNNDFYTDIGTRYVQNFDREGLYNNSEETLRITSILRPKKGGDANIYSNGVLYSKDLTDLIYESSLDSDIVKDQIEHGYDMNVLTGIPFEKYVTSSSTYSIEYQYEEQLIALGAIHQVNAITIYTERFHDRLIIKDYVDNYINPDATVNINFSDYMNSVTNDFTELIKVFSTVLIIFSSVSLVVSSIMIGIITYISIIQRTKEIGLLRSIGARKKDIARLFNVETGMIGFASGILGILGVLLLLDPVNNYVQTMVKQYTVQFRGVEGIIVAQFESSYMLILLFGSIILSLISGFIPALFASRKTPIESLRNER